MRFTWVEKVYERSGKNLLWSIENSDDVLDGLGMAVSVRPVCLLVFVLIFALLCLVVCLEMGLLILLNETSVEWGLLALHVTTIARFLLQKSVKGVMYGLVEVCVMR